MSCESKSQLTLSWKSAVEEYSEVVRLLSGNGIGVLSKVEYERLRIKAEKVRLESDNARLTLDIHRQEHGC